MLVVSPAGPESLGPPAGTRGSSEDMSPLTVTGQGHSVISVIIQSYFTVTDRGTDSLRTWDAYLLTDAAIIICQTESRRHLFAFLNSLTSTRVPSVVPSSFLM